MVGTLRFAHPTMLCSRVPDAVQRQKRVYARLRHAMALLRRAGTRKLRSELSAAWAPVQQRITCVLRRVRGTRPFPDWSRRSALPLRHALDLRAQCVQPFLDAL